MIAEFAREILREGVRAPVRRETDGADTAPWHAIPPPAVIAALSHKGGLDEEEAQSRLSRVGENRLPDARPTPFWRMVADQFNSAPVALLAGSAVLSLATGGLVDAAMTIGVIALNAGIGASTENWTSRLIRSLTRQPDPIVTVIRGGVERKLHASRIAPGDWMALRRGDVVAADARLTSSEALTVDESALTGESAPVEKDSHASVPIASPLTARRTMVFRGGVVTGGEGIAVATGTGEATEIGRVRELLEREHAPRPPMERALDRLGVSLTGACLAASAGVILILRLRGAPIATVLRTGIALAVSAIPEGLPALAASTKALAARDLMREGVLVRNINVVETASNVDVLCLDKTGTLTENRMRVAAVRTFEALYEFESDGIESVDRDVRRIAEICALCNEARPAEAEDRSSGSGTETALLSFATRVGVDITRLRGRYQRKGIRQRSHHNLYMATEHSAWGVPIIAIKGAPDQVLALCGTIRSGSRIRPVTDGARAAILEQNAELARRGLRVLGVARCAGQHLAHGELNALEWLGLIGLHDPVRAGAADAIKAFHRAGVRTIILTGDQAATAAKLAADLDLSVDGSLDTVDAQALGRLGADELAAVTRTTEVFTRVSPSDKLAIIRALQADGHVVAMTGDGVNDGPALRAADIGIAMGRSGADVAREVADVLIAQDDLAMLAETLARGRAADENLRRAVRYLLATNASEVALLLFESLRGAEALETPGELFWLNLMTDVFPALGFVLARQSAGVLDRPPRKVGEHLFSAAEARGIGLDALRIAGPAVLTHVFASARHGLGPRTRGVTLLALGARQLAYAFQMQGNDEASGSSVQSGVVVALGLLAAAFTIPGLRSVLRIAAPRPLETATILGFAFAPLALRLARRPYPRR